MNRYLLPCVVALLCSVLNLHAAVTILDYWRMGDGDSAGVLADSVGARPLTTVGAPLFSPVVSPVAASKTGSAQSLWNFPATYATNSVFTAVVNNFGIELWVYPTDTSGTKCIVYNGDADANRWGIFQSNTTFHVVFGGVKTVCPVPGAALNTWTHLALVRNNGITTVYTNGVAASSTNAVPVAPVTGRFAVGNAWPTLGSGGFAGRIDELRFFNFTAGQFVPQDLLVFADKPSVATLSVSGVSNTVARIVGSVNPHALPTTVWFEAGPYAGNNPATPAVNAGNGSASSFVTNNLTGLVTGVFNHGRIVASNILGVVRGNDIRFGVPGIQMNGSALFSNECHVAYSDAGASVTDSLLAVSAHQDHGLAVKHDGSVAAWGNNGYGVTNVPPGLTNVIGVAAGRDYSLAIRADGSLSGWGNNSFNILDTAAQQQDIAALSPGWFFHVVGLRNDGTVVTWGSASSGLSVPPGLSNVIAVAAGDSHSLALKSDGTIVGWGNNSLTNVPVAATNVTAVSAGYDFSLALQSDGKVITWGNIAAAPAAATNVVAIAAGSFHALALKSDGTVTAWGTGSDGQTNVPPGLSNVIQIEAGPYFSLAVKRDGTLVTWGGYGDVTNVPVGLGAIALTTAGSVFTDAPGTNFVTYTATNSFGGVARSVRTVIVADTTGPVITMNGSNPFALTNANRVFVDPGATALDACGGAFSVTASNNVNVNFPGGYEVTYRSTDSYGNTSVTTRTVVVGLPPLVAGDLNGDGVVSQAELNTVYGNYVTNSPWLYMTNVAGLGGTNVTFALTNSISGSYTVEYSTNLANWQPLGPAVPRYLFLDTNAPASPQRYYRLRWP